MIQVLAKEHGQSLRAVEENYTVLDFWKLVYKNSLEEPNANKGHDI